MREFSITQSGQTIATQSLIALNNSGAPMVNIEFLRWWIGQSGSTTSAQQKVQIGLIATTFPSGGSTTNIVKLKPSDPNASIIVGTTGLVVAGRAQVNCNTDGTTITTQMWNDAFNVLNGWLHVPTPPETMIVPAALNQAIVLNPGATAPGSLTNWAYGCTFREV